MFCCAECALLAAAVLLIVTLQLGMYGQSEYVLLES